MLEDYAEKNGFTGIRHFIDDGILGTTFEHEGLQSMLAEVEKGNIGTIIVKDISVRGTGQSGNVCKPICHSSEDKGQRNKADYKHHIGQTKCVI